MRRFSRAANWVGGLFSFACLAALFGFVIAPRYFGGGTPALQTSAAEAATPQQAAPASVAASTASPVAFADAAAAVTPASLADPGPNGDFAVIALANGMRIDRSGTPLQCAIYARDRTGVSLAGEARTWWPQAEGRYQRTHFPQVGAVMAMLGTSAGHVAVVARVISRREILIDHANWMSTGEIITGAPAVDVSPNNDWSQVRVWHPPTNSLGLRPYPVQGFIIPNATATATPIAATKG
ncbi:MAG: CHAP domain-containing protein [Hyphomonadaceae bacterium]|nr:CHAP domain-containing protein [Hyphomonadaceae bacterium]